MGKSRYIKDDKGVAMSVTTSTLGLEKPLLNENYNIDVHNRNMDKIDEDLTPIDDSYIIELFQHDGDTSRPRDYYTKEESDLKYATKEEVENIDLSNLATKEEVNNALNKANEAFQRGDNVKTQLVDKLISEGLNVSTDNTFEELISNIALGKKWASGNFSTTITSTTIVRINCSFVPSLVFVYIPTVQASVTIASDIFISNIGSFTFYNQDNSGLIYSIEGGILNISSNGFTINITKNAGNKVSLGSNLKWYAFE